MMDNQRKYWIGVASKDHVANGVTLGICQFCHGKSAPAKRLHKGDVVMYYSPKHTMGEPTAYQTFTAIGIVDDDAPFQVEMTPEFKPMRRSVTYLDAQHIDIKPLVDILPFIKNKRSWGYTFRYGFLEIDRESFQIIAEKMLGSIKFGEIENEF